MEKNWFVAVGILMLAVLGGCKEASLSNKEATKQLTALHQDEAQETIALRFDAMNGMAVASCGSLACPDKFRELAELEKRGLVTTRLAGKQDIGFAQWRGLYSVQVSDSAQNYLALAGSGNQMALSVKPRDFKGVKVLAIGAPADFFGHKGSVVKYRVDFQPTPAGQALQIPDRSGEKEAFFAIYDTGWKLEKK